MAANERVVELVLRARDEWKKTLNAAKQSLDALAPSKATIQATLDLKNASRQLTAEIASLQEKARVHALGMKAGGEAARGHAIALMETRSKILIARDDLQQHTIALTRNANATRGSYAAFDKSAQALREQGSAADIARQKLIALRQQQEELTGRIAGAAAERTDGVTATNRVQAGQRMERLIGQARWLKQTISETQIELARLTNTQRGGFAAFDRVARSLTEQGQALDILTPDLQQTTAATEAVAAAQRRATVATDAHTAAARRQGAVLPPVGMRRGEMLPSVGGDGPLRQSARGENQEAALFGLKPWQLTNLAYQGNDVISGLAMGQAPTQVLAQQLGQLLQIFPQFTEVFFSKATVGFAAVAAAIALPIARLETLKNSYEQFSLLLGVNADGARYNAVELAELAQTYDDLGLRVKDVRDTIANLVDQNVVAGRLDEVLQTATRLAKVTGQDLPEAGDRIAKAFGDGFDGIRELDKELNFLTADELENIRGLFDAGDAAGGQDAAFDALNRQLTAGQAPLGAWASLAKEAGAAWVDLKDYLSGTLPIQAANAALTATANALRGIVEMVDDLVDTASGSWGDTPAERWVTARDEVDRLTQSVAELQQVVNNPPPGTDSIGQSMNLQRLQQDQAALLEATRQRDLAMAEYRAQGGGTGGAIVEDYGSEDYQKRVGDFAAQLGELNEERDREVALLGATSVAAAEVAAAREAERLATEANLSLNDPDVQGFIEGYVQRARAAAEAKQAVEDLTEAERVVARVEDQNRSAREQTNAVIREMQSAIATLVLRYGVHNPAVLQAASALAKFTSDARAAEGQAYALAYAASALAQALAALGSFSADLDSRFARAQATIRMAQEGYTEARIQAEQQVAQQFADENRTLIEDGRFTPDQVAARHQENVARLEEVLTLEERAAEAMREAFTPPSAGDGGGGGSGQTPLEVAQENVNALYEIREALLTRINELEESGDTAGADQLRSELEGVNTELTSAIDNTIAMMQAMGGPEARAAILQLQSMRDSLSQVSDASTQFLLTAEDINMAVVDIGVGFIDALAKGENAWDALRAGVGRFLVELGLAIAKQALFNALTRGGMMVGGGFGGMIAGTVAKIFHEGGIVGEAGIASRTVNAAVFRDAVRLHGGGIAGLKPNEVPAVLERGEEVLTGVDPRHSANGGGAAQVNLKNVNVFDSSAVLEAALQDTRGQQVLMNFIGRRRQAIGGMLNR